MFDFIIHNALVYNGLNEKPIHTDVAIQGDQIAAIEPNLPKTACKHWIDATGLLLTPGLIDPHASTGLGYYFPEAATHKLYQGITTEIIGNCGTSTAPVGEHLVATMKDIAQDMGFEFNWRSLQDYFDSLNGKLPFNIGTLLGHSTLRKGYLSNWHEPSELGMKQMKLALSEALDEGGLGMSTGLIYAPGCFAKTEEIIELAKICKTSST